MIDKRTVYDINNNKYNKIYSKLFNICLDTYAKMLGFVNSADLKSKYVVIEKRPNDLLSAPKVILKSKSTPVQIIKNYTDSDGNVRTFEDFWPTYELYETPYNVIIFIFLQKILVETN